MSAGPSDPLQRYRTELLRWNRRFNLLSRRDPESTLSRLLEEGRTALQVLADTLRSLAPTSGIPCLESTSERGAPPPSVLLIDVGAGNGVLGMPWHLDLGRRLAPGGRVRTCLVEPRRKRACSWSAWRAWRSPARSRS